MYINGKVDELQDSHITEYTLRLLKQRDGNTLYTLTYEKLQNSQAYEKNHIAELCQMPVFIRKGQKSEFQSCFYIHKATLENSIGNS